ncbi:phosphopantetheine-binding protein [Roseibium sp.]|uniref:phosphopantetheine-binding protein n=1 Tax=Roseibium sp. TaxID=1936156 RepID=UPI003BABF3D8
MSEISEKVKAVIARDLKLADWVITPDITLSKLGADSLDAIGLIMAIEREIGCCLPRDTFAAIENQDGEWTFGAFAGAIEKSIGYGQARSYSG